MSEAGFSRELRTAADALWQAQHEHPFVTGIGDGSLDPDRFRHFIRQDYLYLVDYGRVFALAAGRAPRLDIARRLVELAHETFETEMALHRELAAGWGVGVDELERERPTPTTLAYTGFLLRTAALDDFAVVASALLPCMWGYSEVGQRLASASSPDGRYAGWIASYAAPEFAALAVWCRGLVDELAAGLSDPGRAAMQKAFVEASRLELAFWDASWRLERPT
ncbi:MAG: thiaminase II [Thermoleophilia bacterium]